MRRIDCKALGPHDDMDAASKDQFLQLVRAGSEIAEVMTKRLEIETLWPDQYSYASTSEKMLEHEDVATNLRSRWARLPGQAALIDKYPVLAPLASGSAKRYWDETLKLNQSGYEWDHMLVLARTARCAWAAEHEDQPDLAEKHEEYLQRRHEGSEELQHLWHFPYWYQAGVFEPGT